MESNQMPKGIPFIIANEFAERFCYYGVNAILAVYMTGTLHFGQARATSWQSIFVAAVYLTPIAGALLSEQNDEWLVQRRYLSVESIALILSAGSSEENSLEQQHNHQEVAELNAA